MAGYAGYGSIFCLGTTSTDQAVGAITNISGPGLSLDTIDVTAHDSASAAREFVGGLIDGGEVSIEGNLISATAANVIIAELVARTSTTCAVIFPTKAFWEFEAIVTGFETDSPHDGKIGFSASVKVTGLPALSTG